MAVADAIRDDDARRQPPSTGSFPAAVTIGGGIVLGVVVLLVAQRPTRWLVYMIAGIVLTVVGIAGGMRRRSLLGFLVVALSLNVHYFVTHPEPLFHYGMSGPTWISIPLVMFPTFVLAAMFLMEGATGARQFRWGFPVARYVVLVFLTALVSTLLSSVRRYGLFTLAEMAQFILLFWVAVNAVRSDEDVTLVIRMLLATLALQTAVFLVQTATGVTYTLTGEVIAEAEQAGLIRASGTVGTTPSGYAIFVEPLTFAAFALWRCRDVRIARVWAGGLALVGGVTMLLTLNRTSWGTLLLGLAVVELLCRARGIARPLSYQTKLSLMGAVGLAAMIAIPLIIPRLTQEHESDWESRRDLMMMAVNMIRDHFLIGVGPGGYPYHIVEYQPKHIARDWLWVVHNEFLLLWAERGILGLLAWLLWLRSGFRQMLTASRTASAPDFQALGIGCFAAFVGLMWEYSLNMWPPYSCYALHWFLFGVLVAGNNVYAEANAAGDESPAAAAAT